MGLNGYSGSGVRRVLYAGQQWRGGQLSKDDLQRRLIGLIFQPQQLVDALLGLDLVTNRGLRVGKDGFVKGKPFCPEKLAPAGLDYRHHQTGEDNADAHLKRTIMGHQVILPITGGALDLGPWEQVFYAEFDGRRKKRVVVKVMGL